MSEQLSLIPKECGTLTATSADLLPGLDFSKWIAAGRDLDRMHKSLNWWIGDWAEYGKGAYGERYRSASEALGIDEATIEQYAFVSRHVQKLTRINFLHWSHHREVATLKPKDQQHWLALASENKWSVSQLRQAIRASQAESKEDGSKAAGFSVIGWATQGLRWFKQRINDKPIEQWPADQRNALKEGLKPIVEVYERL
jgi:hypothetical protein